MSHPSIFFPHPTRPCSKRVLPFPIALLLLLLLSLFPTPPPPQVHASQALGTIAYSISGTVFDDYNQNGTQDNTTSLVEPGINGVIVTAYNAANSIVTSATSSTVASVLGQYSLSIPNGTGPVRVQFGNFGTTSTIPQLVGFQPSKHTAGTLISFVTGTQTTNTVNLGIERPSEYCQNNPNMATSCYVYGDQTTVGTHVVVRFPYNSTGLETTTPPTALANDTDVGSTWGLAYRRSTDDLFAAAYTKQMTGYKPGGSTGAIYLIHNVATTPTIGSSPFVDLNTLFGANTAGANPHTTTNNYNPDTSTFDAVGKIGLGGLAVSEDDSTLYAMNLANKSLYSIPIGAPPAAVSAPAAASITTTALPTPADCTASDMRPFAVTVYRNLVYVGAICSAQSTVVAGTLPYGNLTKLHAYVFVYTPGTGFTSTPVFEIPLNYTRHCAWESGSPPGSTGCNAAAWQAWQSDWSTAYTRGGTDPQPMLTSLAFDNGNLLLGLRDRMGDEGGSGMTGGYSPPIPGGDILRACLNTAGSPLSGWTLENNAVCGTTTITAGQSNGKGPGNGEYYYQQNYATTHDYTALGGLAQIPGNTTVMSTVFDPVSAFFTGGERTYSNSAGTQSTAYEIYNSNTTTTTFGKANGLGALVPLCQSAPIEVGDRVWNDANGNGIQDPGEAGISGATVHLYASNGTTLISTTTTDSTGSYYFTLPASYTAYVIKLDNATDYASGGVLYHLRLTLADKDTTNHLTDSKATLPTPTSAIGTSNYPTIAVASHTPGQNDHSFDIGLTQAPDFFAGKTSALSYGNLALAATPTASSTLTAGGWALSAVNDGQLTSTGSSMGWTSNATLTTNHTEWIQLDLGASYSIQAINLYPRNDAGNVGYGFPMDFTITTSTDGTFWTTLVSKTGYALPNAVQMFTFSTQDARYVLITGTNLRSNPNDANKYRMQFAEITIY